jgi:arginase
MTDFGGAIRQSDKFDIALLGIPYDAKSSYLRGTAQGPDAIRQASTSLMINECTESGLSLEQDTVMVDLGNIDGSGDYDRVSARIQQAATDILARNAAPIFLGGDHSITYPLIKALVQKYPLLDILHFDAHPDLYDELYGDPYSHACSFARIKEEGLAQNLVQVGIRAASLPQRRNRTRFGVRWVEMKDVRDDLVLEFPNPLYISFDMDALDPAFAPGVSHLESGGMTSRQAISIIQNVKARVVAADVVELNPVRDPSFITAAAAVKIVKEIAARIVVGRRSA